MSTTPLCHLEVLPGPPVKRVGSAWTSTQTPCQSAESQGQVTATVGRLATGDNTVAVNSRYVSSPGIQPGISSVPVLPTLLSV